ncbi:lipocalin family protein [Paraflavitalea speifideaquila]|uniref:lipocalin family protein n=1 Tax=Paraflavitalea speifideaquila TaxID=3076558 RepID=UPI0028EDAE77|nr:lipocalin family protein [Paraflavitalea speifideiaquila]
MIPPAGGPQNFMSTLDECEKDDAYTLNADLSAKFEDLGATCSQTTVRTTTWKLDGKNIEIDGEVKSSLVWLNRTMARPWLLMALMTSWASLPL